MKTKLLKWLWLGLLVAAILFGVVAEASAMSSPTFHLDWYVNISGAGGGRSSSSDYTADFTVGQNAALTSSSTSFIAEMGYWAAFPFETYIFLPAISK